MSFSTKFVLLFVALIFASMLYADDASSVKDEAQAQADKISDVEAEINRMNSEASSANDQKWKSCLGKHLGTVKSLAGRAAGIVSKISGLVASGKVAEAQGQLVILSGMTDAANKSLAASQTCERSNTAQQQQSKTDQKTAAMRGSVSTAMSLEIGNDSPTEINRGAIESSDSADAAGVDASGVIQTANDGSSFNDIAVAATETPEDASQVEQVPGQDDQSPTM